MPENKLIGKITHYFSKIGVAVIELQDILSVGDTIRITGGQTDFTQTVDSMEVDKAKVQGAESGQSVGLKVNEKVKEGYQVFKV